MSTFCRWERPGWDGGGEEFRPMRASCNFEVGLWSLNCGEFSPELASENFGRLYVTAWILSRTDDHFDKYEARNGYGFLVVI